MVCCWQVFVAPLLSGAGVKGKVNQAMKYGLPVVGTPIAFEAMFPTGLSVMQSVMLSVMHTLLEDHASAQDFTGCDLSFGKASCCIHCG